MLEDWENQLSGCIGSRCDFDTVRHVAHPLFVPGGFVNTIVVAAAIGDGDFVKFRMEQHRARGVLPARRGAVNADAVGVHVGILFCGGFDPENAVGETGVGEVVPANVVESFGAIGGHQPMLSSILTTMNPLEV